MQKKKKKRMQHYGELLEKEKENIRLTKEHYGNGLGMYIDSVNLLAETFDHISDDLQGHRFSTTETAMMLSSARIISSLKVFIDLVMKGYYYDANVILRSLYENVFLMECFTRDEKYAKRWLEGELKLSHVKKELGHYSDKRMEEFYGEMSDYVHANVQALATLTGFRGELLEIQVGPVFRLEHETALLVFPIIGLLALRLLHKFFRNSIKKEINSRIEKALEEWKIEGLKLTGKSNGKPKELERNSAE